MQLCEIKTDEKACLNRATEFVMGRWRCPQHDTTGTEVCSHSLAPSGRCAFCGAKVAS